MRGAFNSTMKSNLKIPYTVHLKINWLCNLVDIGSKPMKKKCRSNKKMFVALINITYFKVFVVLLVSKLINIE